MTTHARTPFFHELNQLQGSAAAMGYHMPAEWEPQVRVWVDPPHYAPTWPGCLPQAQTQFACFLAELGKAVEVAQVKNLGFPTNDSWIRDYGPIFVLHPSPTPATPRKAAHDFRFNAWGEKYDPRPEDDVIPQHIARHLHVPLFVHDMVLEGGSIEVNGAGTVMTTGQCLLNKNRNPALKKKKIEEALHNALGTRHVIWLPGGIIGDDTDGHIDDIARFVNPTTILGLRAPVGHPDQAILDRNWRVLKRAKDQDGNKLTILPFPVPQPILYDFPPDQYRAAGVRPIPASYANFLICNQHVFVPTFGQATDNLALRILEDVFPGYRIVPIRAEHLVVGLGSLHCLTQQEPA